MPRHRVHRLIDRLFLCREYGWVHRFMDEPWEWAGPRHRRYRHDLRTVLLILAITGDAKAAMSALLHIAADRAESSMRRLRRKSKRGNPYRKRRRRRR